MRILSAHTRTRTCTASAGAPRSLSFQPVRPLLLAIVALLGLCVSAHAQPVGPVQPLLLENADVLNITEAGTPSERYEAEGNLRLRQGNVSIQADRGFYYPNQNRATLIGNVRIEQPGTILHAPQVDYDGASEIAVAPSGVEIVEGKAKLNAGYGEYFMNRRVSNFREGVTYREGGATLTANAGTYYSVEKRSVYEGNVVLRDANATLTASRGVYYGNRQDAEFEGNVRVVDDSGTTSADRLIYRRNTEETEAYGNVVVVSQKESAELRGDTIIHKPQANYTLALGSPVLVQIDSTLTPIVAASDAATNPVDTVAPMDSLDAGGPPAIALDTVRRGDSLFTLRRDTTIISARKLERFAGIPEEVVATDSVRMRRGTLEASAGVARYFPDDGTVALGPGVAPAPPGDSIKPVPGEDPYAEPPREDPLVNLPPDSVAAGPVTGEPAPKPALPRTPVVWYDKSQLTGDTITVHLEEKKLRLIDVVGNAFAVSEREFANRYDQLASERLLFFVDQDTLRYVRGEGQAASIYFLSDSDRPNGVNRSSGDTISITFKEGKAQRIGYYGPRSGVEGEVVPERDVAGQETVYRLSGFRWFPRFSASRGQTDGGPNDGSEATATPEHPSGTSMPDDPNGTLPPASSDER